MSAPNASDTGAPVLRLRQVERSFASASGTRQVLGPLDLDVAAGELVAIMGPTRGREVDVAGCVRGARSPEPRQRRGARSRPGEAGRLQPRGVASHVRWLRIPGAQPVARADLGRERDAAARSGRMRTAAARVLALAARTSPRAASNNELRSPARSSDRAGQGRGRHDHRTATAAVPHRSTALSSERPDAATPDCGVASVPFPGVLALGRT